MGRPSISLHLILESFRCSSEMGFKHRMVAEFIAQDQSERQTCPDNCYTYCSTLCIEMCPMLCPPSLYQIPPPPPPPFDEKNQPTRQAKIATGCILVSFILAFVYYIFRSEDNRNPRNRMSLGTGRSQLEHEQRDDNLEEGSAHPAWFIATVGLQKEIINKIAVLKYRKDNGVVDGKDCSVCLGEFEEEETLRLLPNCRHAFHIQCIDTWLTSHINCPLCRSGIRLDPNINPTLEQNTESLSDQGRMNQRDLDETGRIRVALQISDNLSRVASDGRDLKDPSDPSRSRDITPKAHTLLCSESV